MTPKEYKQLVSKRIYDCYNHHDKPEVQQQQTAQTEKVEQPAAPEQSAAQESKDGE